MINVLGSWKSKNFIIQVNSLLTSALFLRVVGDFCEKSMKFSAIRKMLITNDKNVFKKMILVDFYSSRRVFDIYLILERKYVEQTVLLIDKTCLCQQKISFFPPIRIHNDVIRPA